jgi:hypothetical protein
LAYKGFVPTHLRLGPAKKLLNGEVSQTGITPKGIDSKSSALHRSRRLVLDLAATVGFAPGLFSSPVGFQIDRNRHPGGNPARQSDLLVSALQFIRRPCLHYPMAP